MTSNKIIGDWITAGYDERGRLIQFNIKTQEFRVLDKWVEITKDEPGKS